MPKRRTVTSVFLDMDIIEHIKLNTKIKNLSEWVNGRYPKEFMNIEEEIKKLDNLVEETNKCQERIKKLKEFEEGADLPEEQGEWIRKEGVKRSENYSEEGVLKFFNRTFNQNINLRQFKIFLKRAKEEDERNKD